MPNFTNSEVAVAYANELLPFFAPGSALTMTITREKSGDYSVQTVTEESSEDSEMVAAKFFSETQVNT